VRLPILACLLLLGCSTPTQRIVGASMDIRDLAESSKGRFEELKVPEGVKEQEQIISLTRVVVEAVPLVQDKPSDILGTLWVASVAVACVAIAFLAWHLGIGRLTRSLFGWVPSPKLQAAKLLDEAVDDDSNTTVREAVAAMRALDPDLDLAFRKRHAHPR
jgi:hypothetical protein